MQELIERAAQALRTSRKTIALTGAGISAESGIPTFRDAGGLWDKYDPEEYATIDAFRRDPAKVWQMMRDFTELKNAKPNPGHTALAQLDHPEYRQFAPRRGESRCDRIPRQYASSRVSKL